MATMAVDAYEKHAPWSRRSSLENAPNLGPELLLPQHDVLCIVRFFCPRNWLLAQGLIEKRCLATVRDGLQVPSS
jgi:hypothetical protein